MAVHICQFYSPNLTHPPFPTCTHMSILYIPFLQVPDAAHGGTKPLRSYTGPRYTGGVSDHCPVWLNIPVNNVSL